MKMGRIEGSGRRMRRMADWVVVVGRIATY
jgi:hypothetical protein